MLTWEPVAQITAPPHRDSGRTFKMGGRVWLSQGYVYGGGYRSDLLSTLDALDWTTANASVFYEPYSGIEAVGQSIFAFRTKMFRSDDGGVTGTEILPSLPFVVGTHTPVLVWRGALTALARRVASPQDMRLWQYNMALNQWDDVGPAPDRDDPVVTIFNDELRMVGGVHWNTPNVPPEVRYPTATTLNDMLGLANPGDEWTTIIENLPCSPALWPGFSTFEDRMVLTGGFDNLSGDKNYTHTFISNRAGDRFELLPVSAEPTERHAHTQFELNGELHIVCGNSNPNGSAPTYTLSDGFVLRDPENRLALL